MDAGELQTVARATASLIARHSPIIRPLGGRRGEVIEHARRRRAFRPPPAGLVADREPDERDVAAAGRVLAAYAASRRGAQDASRTDVWADIRRIQGNFVALLEGGGAEPLARYLCNVSRHDATIGITQGDREFKRIRRDAGYRAFLATMTLDKLVSLAEAVGARPVENPEQGEYGVSMGVEPSLLADALAQRLGLDITPPDIDGGLFKLRVGAARLSERDLGAIYTAHLLRTTLADGGRVVEIGGGSGRVAYWSHRMGLTDYTIVDLPLVAAVSGYYLQRALGPARVRLQGESSPADVGVLAHHALPAADDGRIDLVLNQDSIPEMRERDALEYVDWIAASARRFMSINHESRPVYRRRTLHLSVPELLAGRREFELELRFPYWLRKGYVVELYRVAG